MIEELGLPPFEEQTPEEAARPCPRPAGAGGTGPELAAVEDRQIAGVPVRVYRPTTARRPSACSCASTAAAG